MSTSKNAEFIIESAKIFKPRTNKSKMKYEKRKAEGEGMLKFFDDFIQVGKVAKEKKFKVGQTIKRKYVEKVEVDEKQSDILRLLIRNEQKIMCHEYKINDPELLIKAKNFFSQPETLSVQNTQKPEANVSVNQEKPESISVTSENISKQNTNTNGFSSSEIFQAESTKPKSHASFRTTASSHKSNLSSLSKYGVPQREEPQIATNGGSGTGNNMNTMHLNDDLTSLGYGKSKGLNIRTEPLARSEYSHSNRGRQYSEDDEESEYPERDYAEEYGEEFAGDSHYEYDTRSTVYSDSSEGTLRPWTATKPKSLTFYYPFVQSSRVGKRNR